MAITFDGFGNSDVTKLSALKDRIPGEKKGLHRPGFGDSDKNKYVVYMCDYLMVVEDVVYNYPLQQFKCTSDADQW